MTHERIPESAMTPEAQRIAIAEACGWTEVVQASLDCWEGLSPVGHEYREMGHCQIPDYLSDLNAMHEAEKCKELQARGYNFSYIPSLVTVVKRDNEKLYACLKVPLQYDEWLACCIFATAAQRAEAFLRTLNLWGGTK